MAFCICLARDIESLFFVSGILNPSEHCAYGRKSLSEASFFFPALVDRFLARPHLLWEIARAGARWQAQHVPVFSHES